MIKIFLAICFMATMVYGCSLSNDSTSSSTAPTPSPSSSYPTDLAVASPTLTSTASTGVVSPVNVSLFSKVKTYPASFFSADVKKANAAIGASVYSIDEQLTKIGNILNNGVIDTQFPTLLSSSSNNADCYGAKIEYTNHPEGTLDNGHSATTDNDDDGEFPGGDLGILYDTVDGDIGVDGTNSVSEACSAAQLNAKMNGISSKAFGALQIGALMAYINANPTTGILADDINTFLAGKGVTNINVTGATLTNTPTADYTDYDYGLTFDYDNGTGTRPMSISMTHRVMATGDISYLGKMTYSFVNPLMDSSKCTSGTTTLDAGSLLYEKHSDGKVRLDARNANFCEGSNPFDATYGLLNTKPYENGSTSDIDGWSDNYNYFVADFYSTTTVGNYSFYWQAGDLDNASRVLTVNLTDSTSGTAYYGYGDGIDSSFTVVETSGVNDVGITGFYCNWAGPNNRTTYSEISQYQSLAESGGVFVTTYDASLIKYAPTNSCNYTDDPTYPFTLTALGVDGTFGTSDDVAYPLVNSNELVNLYSSPDVVAILEPTPPTPF